MDPTELGPQSIALENAFFGREHAALLEQFRVRTDEEAQRELLSQMVRIQDKAFLDRLTTLGVTPSAALALRLIPLVFVAWADGSIDARERDAVLRAARERGAAAAAAAQELLADWLARKPDPRLLELWKGYVRRLWQRFTPDEQWKMRKNLLQTAREVAEAAGGFLGLAKISTEESKLLGELERLLA